MQRAHCLAVVLSLVVLTPALADKPTPAMIEQAIRDLADKRFQVRERASKLLWEAGADAEEMLRRALSSDDTETVRRARLILDRFDWGIFPDTPPAVVEQIGLFRNGDRNTRLAVVGKLMSLGKPGYGALKRLAEMEQNAADKQALFASMAQEAQKALPGLLAAGDTAACEELLDRCLLAGTDEAFSSYAAFEVINGRLPAAITRWEQDWAKSKSVTSGTLLVHLLRARGDHARARDVAARLKHESLLEQLLWEEGNWKELSALYRKNTTETREASHLGMRAAVHRLAGDQAEFTAVTARLLKLLESDDRFEARSAAESLLLNGRHEDAIRLLVEKKQAPSLTFDLLFTQMRFKEALDLAEAARPAEKDEQFRLDLRRARALHHLGQRAAALERFSRLGSGLKEAGDQSSVRDLVRTMSRLSLCEAAAEQAANYLENLRKQEVRDGWDRVLEPLFERDADVAAVWWSYLRKRVGQEPAAAMAAVRRLLEGPPPDKFDEWAAALAELAPDPGAMPPGDATRPTLPAYAAAVVMLRAGREARAREFIDKAMTQGPDALVPLRYADFLARQDRYQEAAGWYERAAKLAPSQCLPVFLRGIALRKSGDRKEGERLIELAHRMPLGNETDRVEFAAELHRRGFADDARRECDMVLAFGWYRHWHVGTALAMSAWLAADAGDFSRAAALYEKMIAGGLRFGTGYVENEAYLGLPQTVAQFHISGLLREGKYDAALRAIRASLAVIPGKLELLSSVVPILDRAGRKKDADDLFAAVRDRFEALCRDYPDSAFAHNSWAWLAVTCDRDLDRALEHAKSAVRLEPAAHRYLDTLAEVHFRRGEPARAIEIMKKCLELRPDRTYYTRQLARYVKGDRAAPLPADDD